MDQLESEHINVQSVRSKAMRVWADRLGICLSWLCLVHCMMTPVVLLLLPGLSFIPTLDHDHAHGHSDSHAHFHEVLLYVLPVLALAAFLPGFRTHRNKHVFFWGVPGLVLISLGVFLFPHSWESALVTIPGSLLLIRAHLLNRHLCACCEREHREPKLISGKRVKNIDFTNLRNG